MKDDEILARVVSDSICMSSYKAAMQGEDHKRVPENIKEHPVIIGHDFCGDLVKVGAKWAHEFKEGEKFSIQPALNYKGSLAAPGYSYEYIGGDATYIIIPNEVMEMGCLLHFDSDNFFGGSLTEPLSCVAYWSDHCRHTTFSTELKNVSFKDGYYRAPLETTYESYLDTREEIFAGRKDKFVCLMDLALMAMRKLKKDGRLQDMEESDEINACSVVVPVEMDYGDGPVTEEWLVFFKNETHNHPTEIEPFGGAATCLGGAIRDPLSGRGYVYQAMRITGAADPTVPVADTLKGKLPQKKLVRGAASGYSSYGNQIGLATGYVKELYHPDYVAKRMEIGAVMGAAPRKNVIRENSDPGDIIILLGGRTGRDGCGGATGSSKVHTESSIETCGAEVQKGNAPTERKIQRLFRRGEVSRLIKKCNDFGAGGVSVAIGELADGLTVDLDKVPKKYAGLDGTELAISESQERMAVVVDPKSAIISSDVITF